VDAFEDRNSQNWLVLEFMDHGNLHDLIQAHAGSAPFTPEQVRYYFEPVVKALQFIHGKGYVHGDIKPQVRHEIRH
jgi:serine/threonine protein kinase